MQHLTSGKQSGLDQTPAFHFQQECVSSMDLMLPIVQKLNNGTLILSDYTLQEGQVNGLAKAIVLTGKPRIQVLYLDNCNMNDTMTATLFDALTKHKTLSELVLKRNTLLEKSMLSLKNIIQLNPPHNLIELRLVNCQSSPKVVRRLVDLLATQNHFLRSIALVQMKLNFPLDNVAKMLSLDTLQDLDISANDCLPLHFVPLLLALAHSKTIHTVNLSHNQLLDRNDQILKRTVF